MVDQRVDAHLLRRRQLLQSHPEIRALEGNTLVTCVPIAAIFMVQLALSIWVQGQPWWLMLVLAYSLGALLALGLWALLHECSHDLVFQRPTWNKWLGIIVGLPLIVPAAATFRKCHLLHHKHPGDPVLDGDVPSRWEIELVQNSATRKAIWLMAAPLLISLRPIRMKSVKIFDQWLIRNFLLQIVFILLILLYAGPKALCYLFLSNMFSLGLHPLGARWVQEHFHFFDGQGTYSYYGIVNRLIFNAGYHVEHHDMMRVPWVSLPLLSRMAPELYAGLHSYRSWTRLLIRFLFDQKIGLDRRIT